MKSTISKQNIITSKIEKQTLSNTKMFLSYFLTSIVCSIFFSTIIVLVLVSENNLGPALELNKRTFNIMADYNELITYHTILLSPITLELSKDRKYYSEGITDSSLEIINYFNYFDYGL